MNRLLIPALVALLISATGTTAAAQSTLQTRIFSIDDNSRIRDVRDPQPSPDGRWIVYTLRTVDAAKDRTTTNLWLAASDGSTTSQLTFAGDVKGSARWSPDGKKITFLASRGNDDEKKLPAQLWALDALGGEAEKLTDVKGGVSDYTWSPDSRQIVLAADDFDATTEPEKLAGWQRKTRPPIVVNRYHFKQDREGYLGTLRTHLVLFDVGTRSTSPLTTGIYSESAATWSPDGRQLAFFSNRATDPDRTTEQTLFVIDAATGAKPKALGTFGVPSSPRATWSPDGRWIAFLKVDEQKFSAYHRARLAVISADGGSTRVLTDKLNRGVQSQFGWAPDGKSIIGAIDDDGASYLARISLETATVEPLISGRSVLSSVSISKSGIVTYLGAKAKSPPEVHVLTGNTSKRITRHNDAWLAELRLGETSDFASKSKDGTEVHGLLTKPVDYQPGRRYPTLLLIHGGPNGQDSHQFHPLRELLSARGYAVLQVNYRGSSGRGDAFQKAIFADWGNKEVVDLLGAVDWAVSSGIADPERLGLGGWSYGGILTNYTIAQDRRFKAAVSGASSSNQISMYGSDQYILQYELELGSPWKTPELWMKLSYPFFKADRIKTPTLFMSGEKDFNVPTAGAEQMYQALKVLNIDTELVIYPGQFHGIAIPSYQRDVQQRYLSWFDKYLMTDNATKK